MIPEPASWGKPVGDAGYARALKQKLRVRAKGYGKLSAANALYGLLALTGWLATTALATGGLFVALFVAAGNGTLPGFFEQLDLLARHYLVAEPLQRATFDAQFLAAITIIFLATGFFRRAALFAIFKGGVDGPVV